MLKISRGILLISLMCYALAAITQETTSSPYSRYGIGTLLSESFSQSFAMGGVGVGIRSRRNINFGNPASYSELTVTAFEAGFTNSALTLEDNGQVENLNYPHISHLAFGIPVMRNKWGMSFGLLPFSNVGYDYVNVIADPLVGDVTYIQKGNGGLSKVYIGNALQFNIDSTSFISVGMNGYFMFGSLNHDEKVIYGELTNGLNVWGLEETAVADIGADFGVQLQKTFSKKYKITLGATYVMANDLAAKHTNLVRTFTGNSSFGTIKDTISLVFEEKVVVQMPEEYGVGISFEKDQRWTFGVDLRLANWGSIASENSLYNYSNSYSVAVGVQVVPKHDAYNQYLKRVAYRFGGRYNTSYIKINGYDLPEYGITFGVGLPLRRESTAIPQVNIGVEYGKKGNTNNGLIEETFFKFNIGISINDRWFIKRKYN